MLLAAEAQKTTRIISVHNLQRTPALPSLRRLLERAQKFTPELVKIATRTDRAADLARLLAFFDEADSRVPLVVMGTGRLGKKSRLALVRRGAPLHYVHLGTALVPGQFSLIEARATASRPEPNPQWRHLSSRNRRIYNSSRPRPAMNDPIELPETVPVMPLPGALLFPHALLPLHIFEMRYRAMLEHALAAHRMFCVTMVEPPHSDWDSADDFRQVATVGLIRACVGNRDGTSNLILQGLHRVRFSGFVQVEPFPIAEIEPLASKPARSALESDALGARVLDLYQKFRSSGREFPAKVDRYLADLGDPEMLADLMAATFVSDPLRRQKVLEELSVPRRLRLVIQYLGEESGDAV